MARRLARLVAVTVNVKVSPPPILCGNFFGTVRHEHKAAPIFLQISKILSLLITYEYRQQLLIAKFRIIVCSK